MRAVQAHGFGGPEVLETAEVPAPQPGPGQVLVHVEAADVLFVETQIRSGWGREQWGIEHPWTPGDGVAGRVAAVGPGVGAEWVGRRVAATTGNAGAYAERAVAAAESLTPIPGNLSASEAVSYVHDGRTARMLLEATGAKEGERILVTAAAGGLGLLLVQFAHAAGATVVGAARGAAKLALVRDMGADAAVDYTEPDWTGQVTAAFGGRGPDAVFDGAGGTIGADAFAITAPNGRFSAHGAPSGGFAAVGAAEAAQRGITVQGIEQAQPSGPAESARIIGEVLADAAAGRLRNPIGAVFPLERAADAHAALESRAVVGKVLLTP
ncbi:zinc-binding dehydrogenase [Streptomonospora sediminis]